MNPSLQVELSYKQIFKIALPISLALLVPNLNFIINNIFLGQLDNSGHALGIAGITGVYYLVFTGIGYGLNNGLQALISRRAGENRPEEIGKIFHQGILIAMCIAAVGILFTYFIAPVILKAALRGKEGYETAISFLHIRIWGLPFLYIYQMRNALLVGTNQSRLLIAGTLAEAIANVFFDYTLIFGKWGFPELGFNGAAAASIIAEFTGMFVIFLVIRKRGIAKRFSLFKNMNFDPVNAKAVLRMAGPLIFQHAISIVSWLFFYILVERNSGSTGLAVSNTMRNIFGFFGVFIWAFAATTNTMVSNVIGQGKQEEVMRLIKKIMKVSLSFSLTVFILLNLFPAGYLSIYGSSDAFIKEGIPVVRIVAMAMVWMSVSNIWLNAVTGTGNSRMSFKIEFIAIVFYCLYVYFVLEIYKLSLAWGWMSEFLYWSILLSLSYWYMRSGKWKRIRL
jgi:multidrug resistance protein, MATE family